MTRIASNSSQQLFSSLFISMDAVVYLVVPYYVPHVAACAVDT